MNIIEAIIFIASIVGVFYFFEMTDPNKNLGIKVTLAVLIFAVQAVFILTSPFCNGPTPTDFNSYSEYARLCGG